MDNEIYKMHEWAVVIAKFRAIAIALLSPLTMAKIELLYIKKCGGIGSNGFHIKWIIGTHGNWKNQNSVGLFGATS